MHELLKCTDQEVFLQTRNSKALFDLLPDMLFIVREDFRIERMNAAAINRFGAEDGRKCHQVIAGGDTPCGTGICPFLRKSCEQQLGQALERKLGDNFFVDYSHIPYRGCRGDNLFLIILRDITRKKHHEQELESYNRSIENVLRQKIAVLKKSESERQQLCREINFLKQETDGIAGCGMMIGESRQIRELREMIHQVAASDATILISGESGTGKELVADLVHEQSHRKDNHYLKINCAAFAETLLESELFGYEKGAFTGAMGNRKGKFEEADGGTIFLDEIGDISPRMQTSLLRVLQEGEVLRIGSNRTISVDVRIIAATNADLAAKVAAGSFREDLYYRLNVVNLHQAPLRERKEDVLLLAASFLRKYRDRFKKDVAGFPESVIDKLLAYDWPGNVRELENAILRAVLLSRNGVINHDTLGIPLSNGVPRKASVTALPWEQFLDRTLRDSVSFFEAEVISTALRESGGNTEKVSEQLGVGKTTLYEKMKRYGIVPKTCRGK